MNRFIFQNIVHCCFIKHCILKTNMQCLVKSISNLWGQNLCTFVPRDCFFACNNSQVRRKSLTNYTVCWCEEPLAYFIFKSPTIQCKCHGAMSCCSIRLDVEKIILKKKKTSLGRAVTSSHALNLTFFLLESVPRLLRFSRVLIVEKTLVCRDNCSFPTQQQLQTTYSLNFFIRRSFVTY